MSAFLTVRDLVDFILLNRGTTTFMGLNEAQIASMVRDGITAATLFYSTNPENKITGMILAVKDDEKKILFVTENLAMNLSNLKVYAERAKRQWPDYKLEAVRHGSHRKFNTSKLYNKLSV